MLSTNARSRNPRMFADMPLTRARSHLNTPVRLCLSYFTVYLYCKGRRWINVVFYVYFSDVFLPDSPKIPGLKFDRDTSSFWYKPTITRNEGMPSSSLAVFRVTCSETEWLEFNKSFLYFNNLFMHSGRVCGWGSLFFLSFLLAANDILKDSEPGSFIIRDSQFFPGAFGLALKVAVPPAHVLQGLQDNLSKLNISWNYFLSSWICAFPCECSP